MSQQIYKANGLHTPLWSGLHSGLWSPFSGSALAGGLDYISLVSSGVLHSAVTFTRASSGTYYDSAGVLQTALTNVPRIDYDPSTLALRGLLIEEARTNLLTYSDDFGNAVWTKTNANITSNAVAAPDGTTTADELTEDATVTAVHRASITVTTPPIGTYTTTVFVKINTRSWVYVQNNFGGNNTQAFFNVAAGTVGSIAGTGGTSSIVSVGNGWYRIHLTTTTTTTGSGVVNIALTTADGTLSYTGDGTSGLYIWGAQLEAGAFATSYIPTTSAAVTRAADSGICADLSLLGYDQTKGTIYIEGVGPDGQTCDWAQLNNSTINEGVFLYSSAGTNAVSGYRDGGVTQASVTGAITVAVPWKFATAFAANDFASCANGGVVSTDVSGTLGTPTRFVIGAACATYASAIKVVTIKNLRYYWRKFSPAELQALTA